MRLIAEDLACRRSGRRIFAGLSFTLEAGEALTAAFADLDPGEAGDHAATIEASLAGEQLSAVAAWQAYRSGARIGHTYVVLQSGLG